MKLTPEDLDKLQTKQLANVIRKLNAGKTLTAREEAMLAQARAGEASTGEPATGYVRTWDELAAALGVEERSLFDFRQRHKPRIKRDGRALTRADGRHVVAAWRALAAELGELRGRVDAANPQPDGKESGEQYIDERRLRLRERVLLVAKAEHKLAVEKGEVLPLTEYQDALRVTVGAFDAALKQIPARAADKLVARVRLAVLAMLRTELTAKQFEKIEPLLDTAPIEHSGLVEVIDSEIEAARRSLAEAEFLHPDPALA